jgi:DNA polymerase-3 subunit epsilon
MRFAEAGRSGPLFTYGRPGRSGYQHGGPFAVVDVETTGFSPADGDRVIEIAVARVDASGRIEDEYATLINPEGRDTGAVFVHGISNDAVRKAPLFTDVVGDVLARLDGAVVVAHNAAFEERFLAAELRRAGIAIPSLPALCSLWLGQRTFDTPNHKLATLAQEAGIPLVDAHAALGDVRVVAKLLPIMLDRHRTPLVYDCAPCSGLAAGLPGGVTPVTRAAKLRKGTDGWMASLMARLPMSTGEVGDAAAEEYLDALAEALSDGKLVGEEAKLLARIAGNAGMGAVQVAALNERFLETMREAALADGVLTAPEIRQLTMASKLLGAPDYFDDLAPTSTDMSAASSGTAQPATTPDAGGDARTRAAAVTVPAGSPTGRPKTVRRCGHCRQPGHYRSNCPELN